MKWLQEYKKSLKNIHAEEPLDIYFYRPLAFIIVKTFYTFPITPNHYSLVALFSGVAAGYNFVQGTSAGFKWGAIYFLLFAVLDCCDGMVARLKKNGTEFGRLIDGIVDYLVNIIVYVALALGLKKQGSIELFAPWVLVILAGASKAIHSITYDHYLTEYLSYEKGDVGFVAKEIETLKNKLEEGKKNNDSWTRILALRLYLSYSNIQMGKEKNVLVFPPQTYCKKNLHTLKLWSCIGPAVHILFLIVGCFFNKLNLLFLYAIIFGNLWMMMMFFYQFRINHELSMEKVI